MAEPLRDAKSSPVTDGRVNWHPEVRRSYPRYDLRCRVTLQSKGSAELNGQVVNISRGGALVRTRDRLEPGRSYLVTFLAPPEGIVIGGLECSHCGHMVGGGLLYRCSVWGRVLREGRGGGGWASALEFETLVDLHERH